MVLRPRLIEKLNEGRRGKLTLVSAPAGFGKTTLVGEWVTACERSAWLSLDEADGDRSRFLTYLVAALKTISKHIGESIPGLLRSPQQPPIESILATLLNDIDLVEHDFTLVLDDYHAVNSAPINDVLAFLLDNLPPRMHLVIVTRKDPRLNLAKLRARNQLTELRAADLRFTVDETSGFINQTMGLDLPDADIAELETRTEGWVAGMQLAAISIRARVDSGGFIRSFTGSNRFVMDYLVENVLSQQPESVQNFLLRTSILDRLCGSLCDAMLARSDGLAAAAASMSGQETLEYLEDANLFITPMDDERRWYRYHHLFAELLRHRLRAGLESSSAEAEGAVAELHKRAGAWYEANGLELEAFGHAVASRDIDYAARILEGKGMPLHFRGAIGPVLKWLKSLPPHELDARPTLWVMYASALSMTGNLTDVEQKLQAAEAALVGREPNASTRNLIGHIAAIRALLAAAQYQADTIIAQSLRALEYLHPDNLPVRTATIWKLGLAYQLQGNRPAAHRAFAEAIAAARTSGNTVIALSAAIGLGNVQETQNQLHAAAETYRSVLEQANDMSFPGGACDGHLGMARILYQWDDLEAARRHAEDGLRVARQLDNADRIVAATVFHADLKTAWGNLEGASHLLAKAHSIARAHNLPRQLPQIAAAQSRLALRRGDAEEAARLIGTLDLPLSRARLLLAKGDAQAAVAELERAAGEADAAGWVDERLKVEVLQALALRALGKRDAALRILLAALERAEPENLIRIFIDEGDPMVVLLREAASRGMMRDYVAKLSTAYEADKQKALQETSAAERSPVEALSPRELEVLRLIAEGLSNQDIGAQLFLSLSTVKGHILRIFDKLHVRRRTEAVARGRALKLV
jgi:LuxR family maltose regulon positive regulatory protein